MEPSARSCEDILTTFALAIWGLLSWPITVFALLAREAPAGTLTPEPIPQYGRWPTTSDMVPPPPPLQVESKKRASDPSPAKLRAGTMTPCRPCGDGRAILQA